MNTALRIPFLLAAGLLLFTACGGESDRDTRREQRADSSVTGKTLSFTDRVPVDTLRVDCTGDGTDELVIASRSDSLENDPMLRGGFDRIDILTGNDGAQRRLFFDFVDYGRSMEVQEVTGDSIPDVIVRLDAGGNNPIASRGMHLYGLNDRDEVTLLFYTPSGLPVLRDLNEDGAMEILVSDQFWGMVAHSEVIGFTSQIYTYDGGSYIAAKERFPAYFAPILAQKRAAFAEAKRQGGRSEDARNRLYMRMAEYLVWSYARGGVPEAAALWRAERGALQIALSSEQYDDLEAFVEDVREMNQQSAEAMP